MPCWNRFPCSPFGSRTFRGLCRAMLLALATRGLLMPGAVAQTGTFIDRQLPSDLRVVSYNVYWDTIFPAISPVQAAKFERVINALKPDILHLQEIRSFP